VLGLRRAESQERAKTPEYIESSERHGGRDVWCPLFAHSDEDRNALLARAGFEPLPHRSMECAPCINANRADLRALTEVDIAKVEQLEARVGKTMFRSARHNGAKGVREVIAWAYSSPGKYDPKQMSFGCDSGMCGS
jgi:3'-phosphoadenosine 5'-phosphosulfate sulfotransferase (PAPS reductase)/FAD synthetase